jgi:hypothetical protein
MFGIYPGWFGSVLLIKRRLVVCVPGENGASNGCIVFLVNDDDMLNQFEIRPLLTGNAWGCHREEGQTSHSASIFNSCFSLSAD